MRESKPPPADAAPMVDEDAGIQVGGVQYMDEWDKHSTSTASQWSDRGVQFLENGTIREYVDHEGSDHHRYTWRRNQTEWGYPWYKEQRWDNGWYDVTYGDGAVLHVNNRSTDTPSWWQSPGGGQFGYMDANMGAGRQFGDLDPDGAVSIIGRSRRVHTVRNRQNR